MRKISLVLALALAVAGPTAIAQAEAPSALFQTKDLFSLEIAADPQISPDGSRIAYVRRSGDIMTDRMRPAIWLVDTGTGQQTPLIAGTGSHSQPRWSPDGKRIAYVSTAEGGGAQMYVRWMESGESVRITGLPDTPGSIAWSPDGRRIAYTMFVAGEGMSLGKTPAKPEGAKWADPLEVHTAVLYRLDDEGYVKSGYSQIFLVSADGGAPRQLSSGNFHHDGPLSWSADGRSVFFSANRSDNWEREVFNTEIHSLDLASGSITALTDRYGPDNQPRVSPDGRLIAYIGYDDRGFGYHNNVLYAMDPSGANRRPLTASLDRSVANPIWSADSRSVFVSYDDKGETKVARIDLDGSIRTVAEGMSGGPIDRPYTGGSYSVARDGSIAMTSGTSARPADVTLVRGGTKRQLTGLNTELLEWKRLGAVRKITVPSSHDRLPIDAWLTLPANYVEGQRYPLILEIHGGPHTGYGPHFATDNQLYAAAGYVVLSPNPRGSSGYGAAFANQVHRKYPNSNDYDDLMSVVDAAIAQGVADPNRLFVTGGSGGGILTSWIIGKTNRFKAAATQKPAVHMTSLVLTADVPTFYARYWFGHFPWDNPQAYWDRSPLSLVGNVKTPTLVLVGSQDFRTPVSESEQYYTALQLMGVPSALVKVPGANHGGLAGRPSQNGARASAILAWFEKYRDGMPPRAAIDPAR